MEIEPGEVRLYPYLWARDRDRGGTEGRKERRCGLVSVIRTAQGARLVFVLPITSVPPHGDETGVPVPAIEVRPLWVMVDEVNVDDPGRSFYLDPEGRTGRVGDLFRAALNDAVIARRLRTVDHREPDQEPPRRGFASWVASPVRCAGPSTRTPPPAPRPRARAARPSATRARSATGTGSGTPRRAAASARGRAHPSGG